MATTANYSLPLPGTGLYQIRKAVKDGFETLDTTIKTLADRVTALETFQSQVALNDSNSQFFNG